MSHRIFIINPGSSSVKAALYEDGGEVWSSTIRPPADMFAPDSTVYSRVDTYYEMITQTAMDKGLDFKSLDAIAVRGGFCKPLKGGTYTINDALLDDLKHARYGEHTSNVGPFCALRLEKEHGVRAYYTNPVSVDEFMELSYITGVPSVRRRSTFHALNHKAVAGYAAKSLGKKYEEANLIVAHLGGGISIAAHKMGRVVDATSPANEGPMSIDRPGDMPNLTVIDMCFNSGLNYEQILRLFETSSGISAYTGGIKDLIKIEEMALEDQSIALALDTMSYRIAFWICGMAAALGTKPDAIVLTGGMARSDWVVPKVTNRIEFLAPVMVIKGEFEMEALYEGAVRVLTGEEQALEY